MSSNHQEPSLSKQEPAFKGIWDIALEALQGLSPMEAEVKISHRLDSYRLEIITEVPKEGFEKKTLLGDS